jgi:hypothetical protein
MQKIDIGPSLQCALTLATRKSAQPAQRLQVDLVVLSKCTASGASGVDAGLSFLNV